MREVHFIVVSAYSLIYCGHTFYDLLWSHLVSMSSWQLVMAV